MLNKFRLPLRQRRRQENKTEIKTEREKGEKDRKEQKKNGSRFPKGSTLLVPQSGFPCTDTPPPSFVFRLSLLQHRESASHHLEEREKKIIIEEGKSTIYPFNLISLVLISVKYFNV